MEEFQGGVCGGTWWNPPHNLFTGGLPSPCSVAQLGGGGGFDMGNFGWQNDVVKGKVNNNNTIFDNLFFSDQMDSSLDILGFSSTTDWNNHQNLMFNNENNEANFGSIIQENINNNTNNHQDASPSMGMTASSNSSSGDSSTITCDQGGVLPNTFQINSSASYLIQSLFDDSDDQSQSIPNHDHQPQFLNNPITSNFGSLDSCNEIISSTNSWVNSLPDHHDNHNQNSNQYPNIHSHHVQSLQSNKLDEGFNSLINGHAQVLNGQYSPTTLDNIRVSLLNSLQSRSRASFGTKVNSEDQHRRESKNNSSNKDQSPAKRPRIETPSPLPTFKVRKEKLGDRITALQQLVSPFGKTDTASVLHEAIEYIKFLHDQVNVLSTPYLKSGTAIQQQGCEKLKDNGEDNEDLRSKGLCLVPISSTYPMTQETPIDFWTPTFGGTTFR